jgi:hypothetical protein
MAQFDWDKVRRQNRVAQNGAEPNEFPDLTKQIAKAKGFSKARGPWMRACACCGLYYDERAPEQHQPVCRPPPKVKKIKCRKCGVEVDPSRLASHLRREHPAPWWPNDPPKNVFVCCRICGRKVKLRGLSQHLKNSHGK